MINRQEVGRQVENLEEKGERGKGNPRRSPDNEMVKMYMPVVAFASRVTEDWEGLGLR